LRIADRNVQFQYRAHFRKRLGEISGPRRGPKPRRAGRPPHAGPGAGLGARRGTDALHRRQDQILLAAALNHPGVLDEFAERLASINLSQPKLDKLRKEILLVYADCSGLDSDGLKRQLREQGFADELDELLGPDVYVHAAFARPGVPFEDAAIGFKQTLLRHMAPMRSAELDQAKKTYASEPTTENWTRLQTLRNVSQQDIDHREALMVDKDDRPPGASAAISGA
jgi:DNA primase